MKPRNHISTRVEQQATEAERRATEEVTARFFRERYGEMSDEMAGLLARTLSPDQEVYLAGRTEGNRYMDPELEREVRKARKKAREEVRKKALPLVDLKTRTDVRAAIKEALEEPEPFHALDLLSAADDLHLDSDFPPAYDSHLDSDFPRMDSDFPPAL